ncbi:MAG: hypothetical protein KKH98_01420, partial [Spirochaetes bacterium]|nr:hypothetical protein [Spirochaetota bacterium]
GFVYINEITNVFTFNYIAPVVTAPLDETTIYDNPYTFRWDNAFQGVTYELQISDSLSFITILTSVSGSQLASVSILFTLDKFGTTDPYYCRVRSDGPLGIFYSDVNKFYVVLEGQEESKESLAVTETKIFPTRLSPDESVKIAIGTDPAKDLSKVKVVFLDANKNILYLKDFPGSDFSASNIKEVPLADTGLKKGFYFVSAILYYKDNSVSKSKIYPIIIK